MRTNYMMTVDDVMEELGVKRSKAYSILKQLNNAVSYTHLDVYKRQVEIRSVAGPRKQ